MRARKPVTVIFLISGLVTSGSLAWLAMSGGKNGYTFEIRDCEALVGSGRVQLPPDCESIISRDAGILFRPVRHIESCLRRIGNKVHESGQPL